MEKCEYFNPYSGVTNNAAESVNAKLTRLSEYRERLIDSKVLYLNYVQGNDVLELLKVFCGESEWSLLGILVSQSKIQIQYYSSKMYVIHTN